MNEETKSSTITTPLTLDRLEARPRSEAKQVERDTRHEQREAWSKLNSDPNTLFVGMDLGSLEWKLAGAARGSERPSESSVTAFDLDAVESWVTSLRTRRGVGDGPVVFCCEAGRDGFSVTRVLETRGWSCLVVDPASIETSSRGRQAKTDRLDARKVLAKLRSFIAGDRGVFAVVRVPSVEVEDARRVSRERDRLVHERTAHRARIKSLLATQGVRLEFTSEFVGQLKHCVTPLGQALPPNLKAEILREYERLELIEHQLAQLEREFEKSLAPPKTLAAEQSARIKQLRGIGNVTACVLVAEFFWRGFNNRQEVAAAAGLTGTPRATGTSTDQEQGISKTGNKRVRTLMIEIAWSWVRHQPDSPITRWYRERTPDGTKRMKRKAIVAVARRVLIALWRFGVHGVVPEGALMKG